MKKHNWIPNAVIYGSLIFAGSLSGAGLAYGEAPQLLNPNADWKVTKIAAQSAGKDAYCALAQRFTNDIVLTFARNANNENSMAINFQNESFDKGSRYPIILKAGEGAERAFSVKPVSQKAVIVRLGKDKTFFDALHSSKQLSVDINGKKLTFSLSGFDQGERKMYGCLNSLNMIRDASSSTPPPMNSAAVSGRNGIEDRRISSRAGAGAESTLSAQALLSAKARQEADEVRRIQASLQEIEQKNAALKQAVAQESLDNQEKMRQLESVESRMAVLENRKEKILNDMDNVENIRRENLKQSKELKRNIGSLKKEKRTLEAQIVKMERERVSNERAIEDIRQKMSRSDISSQDKKHLESNLTQIERENKRLKNRLGAAEENLLEVVTQSRDIRAKFQIIQRERDLLEDRIKRMSDERAENIRTLDILRGELTSVERERDQLAQELQVLQRVNRDYIESSGLEMKGGLRENLAQIQKQNKALKDILDKKKAESNQNQVLLNEMRNRVSSIAKEKASFAINLDQLETARGEILVQSKALQTTLDSLQQDKKMLEDKVKDMTVERKENIEALELLSEELISLETANKKLNEILTQREKVQASNESTIEKLKKKVVELESYLKLPSEPLREIGMAKIVEDDMMTDLQFKMAELQKKKDDLSDTYTQAVTVNQATQKTIGRLNDQIGLLEEQIENLEEENKQLYTILDKQAFKNEKSAAFKEFVKLQKDNQQLKLDIAELRRAEEERNEFLRETLEDEGESLKTERQLKERIKILVQTNKGLRKQLDAIRKNSGVKLEGVGEDASTQEVAEALSREIGRLKSLNQDLVNKLKETKDRIVNAGGLEALQLQVTELETKNEELTARLNMTKALLANAEKDARVARVPEEVTRYKQEIKKIQSDLEFVRGERDQLGKELELLQKASAEDVIRFSALEERLKKVTEEKLEVTKQRDVLETEKAKLLEEKTVLNDQRTKLMAEKDGLSESGEGLTSQRDALTKENEKLVTDLAALSKEKDELSAKARNLEIEIEGLKTAMTDQEKAYEKKQEELSAELQKDKEDLRAKLEAKLSETGEQLSSSTSYVELLKTERELALADLAKEIAAKEEKIQEIQRVKGELDTLQKAHDLYVKTHSDSKVYEQALEKRIDTLEERLTNLTEERDTLSQELEMLKTEEGIAKREKENKIISSLKERVNKLVDENAELQKNQNEAEVAHKALSDELESSKDLVRDLETKIAVLTTEKEQLTKQSTMSGREVSAKVTNLESEIKELESALEAEKEVSKGLEIEVAKLKSDTKEVASLKDKARSLEMKLADMETEKELLLSQKSLSEQEVSNEISRLRDAKRDIERQLEIVTEDRDRLAASSEGAEGASGRHAERLMTAMKEMESLKDQLEFVKSERDRYIEELAENEDGEAGTVSAEAQEMIDSLKNQLDFVSSERDKLIKKNAKLSVSSRSSIEVDSLKAEVEELESKLTEVETERKSLSDRLETLSGAENIAETLEELQNKLEEVTQERNSLDTRLTKVLRDQEDQRMKISSSSWDLEKATQRFNEAEREISRLGTKIEQSQARCEREKKEIELLLFDPEIAKQAQIDKFKQLKQEVIFAKAQMEDARVRCNLPRTRSAGAGMAPKVVTPSSAPAGVDYSRPGFGAAPSAPSVLSFGETGNIRNFLNDVGVNVDGKIRKRDIPGGVAYNWDTKHLYGSAEQVDLMSTGDYEGHVKRYLDKIKNRCNADFAAIPGPEQFTNKYRANAYEIACVDRSGDGASAAIVFFAHEGKFTVVAHEAGLNGMEYAMDVRDYIMNLFLPDTFSSR